MAKRSEETLLDRLRRSLVVSVQPVTDGPMDRDDIVVAMARAAVDGGAPGLRIEGAERVAAVRAALPDAVLIGIVKRDLADSEVRITPTPEDVDALVGAGADIIGIDGTDRPRPHSFGELAARAHAAKCLVMADIASASEAHDCAATGAAIVGSTLSGYTVTPVPTEPDLAILAELKETTCFVMAEGRYMTPALCAEAIARGADCVTVGSALTRLEYATRRFYDAVHAHAGAMRHG